MFASLLALAIPMSTTTVDEFLKKNAEYRVERQTRLTRDRGWLSLAGLFPLKEGKTMAGDSEGFDVLLPSGTAHGQFGTFIRNGHEVTFEPNPAGGKAAVAEKVLLKLDGDPLTTDRLTIQAILRSEHIYLRVWDKQSPALKAFTGCKWFAPDPKWVIQAKFVPYLAVRQIPITNVLGDVEPAAFPGEVVFTVNGHEFRLAAQESGDELFINFQDATSGKSSYGAGRFLYADKPKDGVVTLDFNRAENPPCAFTPYATCPLPPRGNRISVAVEAGEKTYGHGH